MFTYCSSNYTMKCITSFTLHFILNLVSITSNRGTRIRKKASHNRIRSRGIPNMSHSRDSVHPNIHCRIHRIRRNRRNHPTLRNDLPKQRLRVWDPPFQQLSPPSQRLSPPFQWTFLQVLRAWGPVEGGKRWRKKWSEKIKINITVLWN